MNCKRYFTGALAAFMVASSAFMAYADGPVANGADPAGLTSAPGTGADPAGVAAGRNHRAGIGSRNTGQYIPDCNSRRKYFCRNRECRGRRRLGRKYHNRRRTGRTSSSRCFRNHHSGKRHDLRRVFWSRRCFCLIWRNNSGCRRSGRYLFRRSADGSDRKSYRQIQL